MNKKKQTVLSNDFGQSEAEVTTTVGGKDLQSGI
jgi:hypothetical protein